MDGTNTKALVFYSTLHNICAVYMQSRLANYQELWNGAGQLIMKWQFGLYNKLDGYVCGKI